MGFYIDLQKAPAGDGEFTELQPPAVFWVLYAIAGFALTCMGTAAHAVMKDLARVGSDFDVLLVGMIVAAVPFYLLVGIKLLSVRKFVRFRGQNLEYGFRFFGHAFLPRTLPKASIRELALVNQRPAPNVAPGQHEDKQYYVRGHWRVIARLQNGKNIVLDRHTDQAALEPLLDELRQWRGFPGPR